MAPTRPKATSPPPPEVQPALAARERPARSGLPRAWAGRAGWTILDTRFGAGEGLTEAWQAWKADPQRPQMLHYVGHISLHDYEFYFGKAPSVVLFSPGSERGDEGGGKDGMKESSDNARFLAALQQAAAQRSPGIHRILLEGGQVSVTLCIGEFTGLLADHRLYANTVWISPAVPVLDKHAAKALARVCARGAVLVVEAYTPHPAESLTATDTPTSQVSPPSTASYEGDVADAEYLASSLDALREAGFVDVQRDSASGTLCATFNPAWSLGAKEPPSTLVCASGLVQPNSTLRRCCVVGAGISGASVAYAMARRGWRVTVLDAAPQPAGGASGLPVGLVVPHISADDSPRSRLSRVGARLMLQHTSMLLREGHGWALSGVREHLVSGGGEHGPDDGQERLHERAGWVRPAALVRAWLAHPGIALQTGTLVAALHKAPSGWRVLGPDAHVVEEADVVIFANAYAARDLLSSEALAPHRASTLTLTLSDLRAVHGTASLGHMPSTPGPMRDAVPHNGHGCFIPGIPGQPPVSHPLDMLADHSDASASDKRSAPGNARWWLAGSSFEPDETPTVESLRTHQLAPLPDQLAGNLQRLQGLLPEVAAELAPQFHADAAQHWSGTRCVTHDRLPLAGPVDAEGRNGLWMHVGMGARGLTFSALGAELIAARIGQEPWPVESSLARSFDSQRLRKRRTPREPESDSI